MKHEKSKNNEILAFRIDTETIKKLEELAAKEDRTISSLIRLILKKHIEKSK